MSTPLDEYFDFQKESALGATIRGVGRGLLSGAKDMPFPGPLAGQTIDAMERGYGLGQKIQEGALSGAAAAGGAALVSGLGAAAHKIIGAISKRRDFNEMMQLNDDLREYQQQDDKMFNAAYSSLRRMNPTYASDPVVAGAHMRKMMENPEAAGLTLVSTFDKPKGPKRFF